jgi:hypothetical protein
MPTLVLLWVWFCAYLNCAGWALSTIHQLNAGGYAVVLALGFVALLVWRKKTSAQILPQVHRQKFRRRFRRPFPLGFLILATIVFLGGALYAPNNYDALAYRIPRVLHWLAAGQWHWIHTDFNRLNTRGCGLEWVSAPGIALFKTDRFLFLINFISFLFLPGLVFSIFTRLGVRRRVAWHWMWIVPTGYGFLLQGGGIGSDLFGVPFVLAAVDFALRAKISGSSGDFFTSILAAALMTSPKTSSLPLGLPWLIALLPSAKLIFRWPLKTLAVCVLAVFASVLPTMFLNQKISGDWSGMAAEQIPTKKDHAVLLGANLVLVTIQNFAPPVFPWADKWNHAVEKIMPPNVRRRLDKNIEWPGSRFHLDEMQIEENAGLGFGVSILLLASLAAVTMNRQKKSALPNRGMNEKIWLTALRWSPFVSAGVLIYESSFSTVSRYFIPYYVLLIAPLIAGAGHERLVNQRWWRATAAAVFFIAAGLLVVSPARPLFPVQTILQKMQNAPPRAREVYLVYRDRNDAFAPARDILPSDMKVLGLVTFDDPETSLWRPFGSRRVEHVCPQDTPADLKQRGVAYVLVSSAAFGNWFSGTLDDWLKKMDAQLVQKISLNLRAGTGPLDWYLIKLN